MDAGLAGHSGKARRARSVRGGTVRTVAVLGFADARLFGGGSPADGRPSREHGLGNAKGGHGMNWDNGHKVTASHLKRNAYLYVRQSTIRQVFENTESTKRQYALRERAAALGWPPERIIVIDCDLGQSGASAADRQGFQRLVTEVGLGRAGIVLGLEVSRLARNCSDWHRLLEICALADTLILDEDGLYDPSHFNDRLLLGLKGTMSEAELHVLHARLQGGIRAKARRGELKNPLPVGLVYDAQDHVVLDPDRQVQQTLQAFFAAFQRTGTALGTVKDFNRNGLLFPRRLRRGARKGELVWAPLLHSRALQVLHNPRYAGAFVHGRQRPSKTKEGRKGARKLPQEEWEVVIPDAHPGYIIWQQYQRNQQQLRQYAQTHGADRRKSPPGEGPALLQGLAVCGLCGQRMTIRYHQYGNRLAPQYVCQRDGIEHGRPFCQSIPGSTIDQRVGQLLVESMTPVTLEVAMAVQRELQSRLDEADRLRKQQVERVRYEAELAEARYMQVDPKNRLVADALEADWNAKLRTLREQEEEYEAKRQADRALVDEKTRADILALATDFPRLWRSAKTSDRQRKQMVRLLIEDVTLLRGEEIRAQIRFKGGATQTLTLPLPPPAWKLRLTRPEAIAEIDRLLDDYTDDRIAAELKQRGLRTGTGGQFTRLIVGKLRHSYGLTSRYERLRQRGMLTQEEMAKRLDIHPTTVRRWGKCGLLKAHPYNDKNQCLYEPVGKHRPLKTQGMRLDDPRRLSKVPRDRTDEVQDEA
jgi:DNA invertase Pin-like site-specific DNA recombinase